MSRYRVIAADLLTGAWREEVPVWSLSSGRVLDRAGPFTAQAPLARKRVVATPIGYRQAVTRDAPAGYWRLGELDGTAAYDIAGSAHDGVYHAAPALGTDGLLIGDGNAAVAFDGATGYVSIADADEFSPATLDVLTIEALFSPAALPGAGSNVSIVSKAAGSQNEWSLRLDHSGVVHLRLFDASGASLLDLSHSGAAVVVGGVYYVCGRINNGGICALDLAAVGNVTGSSLGAASGSCTNQTAQVNIARRGSNTEFFAGTVDEVAIYPAVLSDARVAAHARAAGGDLDTEQISYSPVTRSVLDPGRTALLIERDGSIINTVILWSARATLSTNLLELGGSTLWSYWRRRPIRSDLAYAAVEQITLARALLAVAAAVPERTPYFIDTSAPGITSAQLRDLTVQASQRTNPADQIETLAALVGGFDFDMVIDPHTGVGTWVPYYPHKGTTDVSWVLDIPMLEELTDDVDASNIGQVVDTIGANVGATTLIATASDAALLDVYPEFIAVTNYSDVGDAAILDALAGADLAALRQPVDTPVPTFRPGSRPDLEWGTWALGDRMRMLGARGWLELGGNFRIVADELRLNPGGDEVAKVTITIPEALS